MTRINSKYECEVIIFNKDVHSNEVFDLDVKLHFLFRKSAKDILAISKFYKIAREFQPDIIHAWDTLSMLYTIPAAKLIKTKLITSKITMLL